MRVLLTGGAGYIGSHTAVVLAERGHEVVIVDDYSNAHPEAVRRVAEIVGKAVPMVEADLANQKAAAQAFTDAAAALGGELDAVIHFAGLKAVGESVAQPTRYYRTNINSTLNVLDQMRAHSINRLVFSSSATVYGDPETNPIAETQQVGVGLTNPYGWSKAMNEQIIRDAAVVQKGFRAVLLRYFNPVGAHESGRIGEDPSGIPNNLMPFVAQVAVGKREQLSVFGSSYPTPDGTGVRDYIHVMDLAEGHAAALEAAGEGVAEYNLGSGKGSSVLEVVAAFEQASGRPVPYQIVDARPGDVAECVADPRKANSELNWQTTRSLADACADSWRWQSQNPNGYAKDGEVTA
ncbi:UDP-glucose 4-epimerase GalE [Canibacter zhoujuaniae]|uniref:UDP-glucose 4-epimerase GalE n=1 Tax=Canibacter zhoujuaniae TaxID=2708343 RepID=UPI00141EFFC6|nr:UDP-glucose 4-epimerase GalE [Canibacter zhoujuaniae]